MNKKQRVQAVLSGGQPDVTPAGFWFHYPGSLPPREMADAHLALYRDTGMDIVKLMQDYPYPVTGSVQTAADWRSVGIGGTKTPAFNRLADVLRYILEEVGDEVLVFQTMFSPFKAASIAFGDEKLMAHAREDAAAVKAGITALAEGLAEWAAAYVELGAAGLYFSAQFSEPGRFTREEWADLVAPADKAVLNAARAAGGKNILHICGEPEFAFETNTAWFQEYPGDLINWSVKDTGLGLSEGRALFGKPILGGMNNKGNILAGSDEAIRAEATAAIKGFGQKGFMLGADCTIQGDGISHGRIRAAVDAAHEYKPEK